MKAYWDSLTKEQQGELAGKVGSTPGYLRLVFNGYKKASFVLAKKLEQCTSGAITKSDLRPDNQLRDQFTERLESMATDNCARWVLSVVRRDTWLELFQSWWRGDTPLGAVIMSIVMAGLRIAYFGGGGGWKRKTLEILLCGALTLTFASALEYVGWPKSLSVAIGGGVGLIGVDAIRGAAMRVIGNKFGSSKE